MKLGEALKLFRKIKRLTQKEVASYINVSDSVYARYERGVIIPPTDTLFNLASFLNIPNHLLFEKKHDDTEGYNLFYFEEMYSIWETLVNTEWDSVKETEKDQFIELLRQTYESVEEKKVKIVDQMRPKTFHEFISELNAEVFMIENDDTYLDEITSDPE